MAYLLLSTKAYILDIGTYILIFRLGKPALLFSSTDPDWVPSLKLGHDKIKVNLVEAKHRHSRVLERSSKKQKLSISDVADSSTLSSICPVESNSSIMEENTDFEIESFQNELQVEPLNSTVIISGCDFACQTSLSFSDVSAMESELVQMNEELYGIRDKNKKLQIGTYEWFDENNKKVLFHTGLPNLKILVCVFDLLKTSN